MKTLKDIDWTCQRCGHSQPTESRCVCNDEYSCVEKAPNIHHDLREAAREWVKELSKPILGGILYSDAHKIEWIKHFFNIKEEKL